MAKLPEQENTVRRRPEILDADYVPRDAAPVTPRAAETHRSGGMSPVTAVTMCIALLTLAMAVSRGDSVGKSGESAQGPELRQEARWSAAVADDDTETPAEEALGAALETLSAPVAAYYSMKDCPRVPGTQVCAVEEGGAAAAAGLAPGDVITAVNGRAVLSAEELSDALCPWNGEEVFFTVYRGGETLELTVGSAEITGGG